MVEFGESAAAGSAASAWSVACKQKCGYRVSVLCAGSCAADCRPCAAASCRSCTCCRSSAISRSFSSNCRCSCATRSEGVLGAAPAAPAAVGEPPSITDTPSRALGLPPAAPRPGRLLGDDRLPSRPASSSAVSRPCEQCGHTFGSLEWWPGACAPLKSRPGLQLQQPVQPRRHLRTCTPLAHKRRPSPLHLLPAQRCSKQQLLTSSTCTPM